MSGYKSLPFWSWNDELNPEELRSQIRWMHDNGIGGFFMHARSGLKTEYLSKKWMECIEACADEAKKLGMEAWAYDENGWPSGFCGGKLLEDENNCDCYFTQNKGKFDKNAYASYKIDGNKLIKSLDEEDGAEYVNVYFNRSVSTADILNKDVVKKFIDSTHERYKNEINGKIYGFFTDEPQYYRAGTPFTTVLIDYFKENYNEDVTDNLALLFYDYDGYKAFRYKYYKALNDLMLNSFAKQIYDWCEENGYQLTGHYIEERSLQGQMLCCAGVMPFYEYQHIPGIDFLTRVNDSPLMAKQLDSVATQLGKKYRLIEIFALTGWSYSPRSLKALAESFYAGGINVTCQHLIPVTERGNRKRDYPEHFSWVNPWVEKNFKEFNEYFNKLSEFVADTECVTDVGIFHPIRSAYFDYKRDYLDESVKWLNDEFERVTKKYANNHIMFHYIDETLLKKYGSIENGVLKLGNCSYKYLVFPSIYTMDKSSYNIISEFIRQGGKVLFEGLKPTYLEDKQFEYNFNSNVTFDEIKNSQLITVTPTKNVFSRLVRNNNGELIFYAVNHGDNDEYFSVYKKGANSLITYDMASDVTENVDNMVCLKAKQSKFIKFSSKVAPENNVLKELNLYGSYELVDFDENYLTIDNVEYSYDGVNYFEKLNVRKLFQKLLNDRYKGDLYVKYSFNAEFLPNDISFVAENQNVYFNGTLLTNAQPYRFGRGFYKYNVTSLVKVGNNEAVLKYDYFQNDNVYYALFGENVTESLRNCLVYDTDIECAYVVGKFGVNGTFTGGVEKGIIRGKDFKIVQNVKTVKSVVKDGFPFKSGDITLKKTIYLDDVNYKLVLNNNFHIAKIKINGKFVCDMMLYNEVDISKYLSVGNNEFELTLTISNRNTLGPFHSLYENPCVGPSSWDGCAREDYAFVETLI